MSELIRPEDWNEPVTLPEIGELRGVLVPFDGSHNAERAAAWALRLAAPPTEIIVLVAYERPLTKRGRGLLYVDDMRRALNEEATELATETCEALAREGAVARAIVVEGEPALAVLDTADTEDVDLIVMGQHGLTSELTGLTGSLERVRSALHGSVADRVLRYSTRPVLVVP